MQKLILMFLVVWLVGLTACSTLNEKPTRYTSLGTNFDSSKSQYIYCQGESCIPSTQLEEYTIEDFRTIEPEPIPTVIVHKAPTQIYQKHNKKHKRINRKTKRKDSNLVKCFIINKNESGNIVESGNKLLPANSDTLIMDPVESLVQSNPESEK